MNEAGLLFRRAMHALNGRAMARPLWPMSTKSDRFALILLVSRVLVRPASNQAAEADAACGGIMMGTFEPRRSLAAIR